MLKIKTGNSGCQTINWDPQQSGVGPGFQEKGTKYSKIWRIIEGFAWTRERNENCDRDVSEKNEERSYCSMMNLL